MVGTRGAVTAHMKHWLTISSFLAIGYNGGKMLCQHSKNSDIWEQEQQVLTLLMTPLRTTRGEQENSNFQVGNELQSSAIFFIYNIWWDQSGTFGPFRLLLKLDVWVHHEFSVDENCMVLCSALLMLIGTQGPTGIWHMPTYNIHWQMKKHSSVGLGQWIAGSTGNFSLG